MQMFMYTVLAEKTDDSEGVIPFYIRFFDASYRLSNTGTRLS